MAWQGSRLGIIAETVPSRLYSRDRKIRCYGDALSTIFLLAFVPCFLLFVFLFFLALVFSPSSRYVYLLRVPSSVQQSATLSKYVFYGSTVRVLSACVICTLPHLGILLFLRAFV